MSKEKNEPVFPSDVTLEWGRASEEKSATETPAHYDVFRAVIAWMLKWKIRIPGRSGLTTIRKRHPKRFAMMELEATLKKLVPDYTGRAELLEACRFVLSEHSAKPFHETRGNADRALDACIAAIAQAGGRG